MTAKIKLFVAALGLTALLATSSGMAFAQTSPAKAHVQKHKRLARHHGHKKSRHARGRHGKKHAARKRVRHSKHA